MSNDRVRRNRSGELYQPLRPSVYQAGIAVSPAVVTANLDAFAERSPGESTVEETLGALETEGVVRELDEREGYYLLTEHGRDYVETEIDQTAFGFID